MQTWKRKHATRIANLFQIQTILDENVLLEEISSLLDIDEAIFGDCGPFSESVINGTSGDGLLLWRNRCLDTILPNNQRIVQLIDSNRRHFPYQWDVYDQMIAYKVHVDAFQDNCLTGRKINDYKTFPVGFNNFVKGKLGRQVIKHEKLRDDKVDYRPRQISKIIDLLSIHQLIHRMSHINLATMLVELKGGKVLKVFVTTSYFFTDYTFDRIMEIDPSVDTIINFHPAGSYTGSAKRLCIDNKIGLFTVGEFMGAIRQEGNDFLNYLLRSETSIRKRNISRMIKLSGPPPGRRFYVFGSYLRRKVYNDIDIMLVYQTATEVERLKDFVSSLVSEFEHDYETLDLTVASAEEFRSMKLEHDNLLQVYP